MKKYLPLLLLLLLLFCTSLQGATYYVSKTGLDSHACSTTDSAGTNKLTITAGLGCLAAGDTLDVHTGVYNENLQNIIPAGISAAQRTRLIGHAGETVEIKPTMACPRVISNNNRPYVEISHLTLTGGSNVQYHLIEMGGSGGTPTAHHCLVENNIMTHPGGGADTHTVLSMTDYIDNTDNIIRNNTISNYASTGYSPGVLGIYTTGSNTLIEGNVVHCNTSPSGGFGAKSGIRNGESQNRFNSNNSILRNNIVDGCYIGIYTPYAGNDRQIYNNIVYSTPDGTGMRTSGNRTLIYNNTVYSIPGEGIQVTSGSGHIVKNNILSTNIPFTNAGSGTVFSNNLCSNTSSVANACLAGLESSANTFVTPGSDFNLKVGSKAIGTGANLSTTFTTDYAGTTRTVPWDIGAYKSSISPSITINSPISGGSWQIGASVTIGWTGTNLVGANVDITGDLDGNGTYEQNIALATPNDSTHPWTVTGSATTTAKIKVKDTSGTVFAEVTFTLTAAPVPGTITINSPITNGVYTKGSDVVISWGTTNVSGNVLVELSRNNGSIWETIGTYTYNATDIVYTATTPSSSACKLKITSVNDPTVTTTSGTFRLGGNIM